MSKPQFLKKLNEDPGPCDICEAIKKTYYETQKSLCDWDGSCCLDKDKAIIKLVYETFKRPVGKLSKQIRKSK